MENVIDVNNPMSWPAWLQDIIVEWGHLYAGETEFTSDLSLPTECEHVLLAKMSDCLLRAYHCTRLLPHEVTMIQQIGLRPLSEQLIHDRIDAALSEGDITMPEAALLRNGHVYASGAHKNRDGMVALIVSDSVFKEDPLACEPLLTTWGGEAIYMTSKGRHLLSRLKQLGTPSLVVANVKPSDPASQFSAFPSVDRLFVGVHLGLRNSWADVFLRVPVPPEQIASILQPGDWGYDVFTALPRA